MKQIKTDSRRGGSARQVHHKFTMPQGWGEVTWLVSHLLPEIHVVPNTARYAGRKFGDSKLLMGLTQDRLGQKY